VTKFWTACRPSDSNTKQTSLSMFGNLRRDRLYLFWWAKL
jgi:hypothetical protein